MVVACKDDLATTLPILATTRNPDTSHTKSQLLSHLGPLTSSSSEEDIAKRLTVVRCDVTDESSIAEAAAHATELFPVKTHHLRLACVLPGILHPEKSLAQIDAEKALDMFRVNALGALLVAKIEIG